MYRVFDTFLSRANYCEIIENNFLENCNSFIELSICYSMHKISIIIPVYNVEQYLPQCLNSVINQAYQNLEIILVNDGSTDSCPQICDEYAVKDDRIKVIHKKNGGLSDARNAGLQMATGDFISFVDSDDLLSCHFYLSLLKIAVANNADISECGFCKFGENEKITLDKKYDDKPPEVFETEEALKLIMEGPLSVVVWNKIYRKEVIAQTRFPINKINEDEYWTYKVFANSKKIVKTQEELYFYRQQAASIMGQNYSLKRLDALEAHEERVLYIKEKFPKLEPLAIKVFCFISMSHYHQISIYKDLDPQRIIRRTIFSKVQKFNRLRILKNWYWKDIVWYQLFLWSPKNYMNLRDHMDMKAQKRLHIK